MWKRIAAAVVAVVLLAPLAVSPAAGAAAAEASADAEKVPPLGERVITLPSAGSPLIAVRLLFRAGSIHDPQGKEGLAALTALMVGRAGTAERSYRKLVDALYPMAASIDVLYDREAVVISGEIHRDKLAEYTALLTEAVLSPGFAEADFRRNKEQLLTTITDTLRASNDELLGLEALQSEIFAGHPYEHPPVGTVEGLEAITLDDVKRFHRRRYTQAALMLGVAGGYPEAYPAALAAALSALPEGKAGVMELPAAKELEGRHFTLIDKQTGSVGIHFGHPLAVDRSDPAYYPLMVANSYLGEHRTFHGRLMQQLRGKRGLNYGDYSYVEYWHLPPFTSSPTPGVPRRQQYFSVWIRPVVPETAHFALRNALFEVERLIDRGLTEEELDLTREFLINYSKLWAQTLADRLGFLMDSHFYGMDDYIAEIEERLAELDVETVNAAVREHLQSDDLSVVLVTADAAAVEAYLEAGGPSPMEYNAPPEKEVAEADETIQKVPVEPASFEIVPVTEVFQE